MPLAAWLVLGQSAAPVQILVGATPVEFAKAKPVMRGKTLLIPLRTVVEKMGGTMVDGPLRRRTLVTVGARRVDLSLSGGRSWVNGVPRYVQQTPSISRGEVVVPVEFFARTLGVPTVRDPRRGTIQFLPRGRAQTSNRS